MIMKKIKTISFRLAVNLQTRTLTMGSRQKGASALEYIVLAAVLVGILTIAMTNDTIKTQVSNAFSGLFTDAATAGK